MAINFDESINKALAVVGVLFGAVLVIAAAVAVAPRFFTSLEDANEFLGNETVSTGDETADGLKPIFRIILGIIGLVGFVGILITAVTIKSNNQ